MNKILVAIGGRRGAWGAFSHACALAKRIQVNLSVLWVMAPDRGDVPQTVRETEEAMSKRLALLIETAKAEGITINYFRTEGNYEEEVINFVNHHKIMLLVLEALEGDTRSAGREAASLRALRHRLSCTVEVVAPIKNIPESIERIT